MTFRKILCPTDFSPGSETALRHAAQIARLDGAELVIGHAFYAPPALYSAEYIYPSQVIGDLSEESRRLLDASVRDAIAAGAPNVVGKLVNGVPWAQLVELLEAQHFDLCVMGTHGRTGLRRVLLGSVAEKVIRHAPCSVLTVRPDAAVKPYTHVFCPTDFSPRARTALDVATRLVQPSGTLTIMHVIEIPVAYAGEVHASGVARELDRRAAEALAADAEYARTRTQAVVKTSSRIGYAGAQTVAALDDDPTVDLVVMGSHGRTGLVRALLGSVAEKVVRHARSPVLVTRTPS